MSQGDFPPKRPPKLTKSYVDGLKDPGDYREQEIKGFYVRVNKKGSKTYCVENSVGKGGRRSISVKIGRHGQISTEDARQKARKVLLDMSEGIDPSEERKKRKEQEKQQRIEAERARKEQDRKRATFGEVFSSYLAKRSTTGKKLKSSTAADYQKLVEIYLSDWLCMPIADISKEMVEQRFTGITNGAEFDLNERVRKKGSESQANKVFRVVRAIFNYADAKLEGPDQKPVVAGNPTSRLKGDWHKIQPRQRIIKDSDLKRWYQAVMSLQDANVRDYLRLLLFTGFRRNEAAGLRWENVSFEEETLMVTDTKNSRNQMLPMTTVVREILASRRELLRSRGELGEFVFPSRVGGHLTSPYKQIAKVREECDVEFSSHDLRRTIATIADGLGIDFFTIGRLLNHKSAGGGAVTKDYIVATAKALREPLERITDGICEQIGIAQDRTEVVADKY